MIVAAEQFVAATPAPRGRLAFLITSDEEGIAIDGTRRVIEALIERGERIDHCLIGEPSSEQHLGDRIRIGRRGSLTGKLTVHGTQGHVAYPDTVDNPIHRAAPFLDALRKREWDHGNQHFPATSLQIVGVRSGLGVANVVPGVLTAEFNFRYSTEWTSANLQQAVESLCRDFNLDFELDWHLSGEPFLTPPGPFTWIVENATEQATGRRPELSTGGGTSDGRFISPAGADVVELGPVGASIHKKDECVRVADVVKLGEIYRRIIDSLLG
jgi:succinyl-diaminopimelate desuccinylase